MKNALIWDPDELIRALLRDVLEYHGFRVWEAENHEKALSCLRGAEVDLVFFDWNSESPHVSDWMCDFRSLAGNPRLIALGSCVPEQEARVEREVRSAGASQLLLKPFGVQDLMRAVHGALEGNPPGLPWGSPKHPSEGRFAEPLSQSEKPVSGSAPKAEQVASRRFFQFTGAPLSAESEVMRTPRSPHG